MTIDSYTSFIGALLKAWQSREQRARVAVFTILVFSFNALAIIALSRLGLVEKNLAETVGAILLAFASVIAIGVVSYQNLLEQQAKQEEIATVQERVLEHPEKPQFAWDLARTKLENYLDRNLAQVRSIYWLTLFVMTSGFGFVMYGLYYAFQFTREVAGLDRGFSFGRAHQLHRWVVALDLSLGSRTVKGLCRRPRTHQCGGHGRTGDC